MDTLTPPSLLDRARRALGSAAAATLALAPLATQAVAAAPLDTGDLTVDHGGAYFYNASGYFATWDGQPGGGAQAIANPDGSTKFYGDATATAVQMAAHNCHTDPWAYCGNDRGVALVWSGTLASPAAEGDRLVLSIDFTVTVPAVGGQWGIGARLAGYDLGSSNSLSAYGSGAASGSFSEAGTYRVHGTLATDALQSWDIPEEGPLYWQVFVTGLANADWSARYWSDTYHAYVTPYAPIALSVPAHSIDVAHADASWSGPTGLAVSAVPEPGTWAMLALGLVPLLPRLRRR